MHKYEFVVQETYLDVFGHVNNAVYMQLFEEARWNSMHGSGLDVYSIMNSGIGPVILSVELKFIKELKARQKVTIQTYLKDTQGIVGRIAQQMLLPDGTVAADAIFTFGIFDMKARKLVMMSEPWTKIFQN